MHLRLGVENEHKHSFSGVVGLTEESGKTQCYVNVVSSGVLTPIKTRGINMHVTDHVTVELK